MSALPDRDRSGQARLDEPALVASALAGDREALGTLVEWYAGSVRRVTRAILGNVDDAEDAAQDGVLAALVKLDRYDPTRPFGPWLLRIVPTPRSTAGDGGRCGKPASWGTTSPRRARCRTLRPSAWRWATGSAPHWMSCRSITGWRSCCSMSRATRTRRLRRSWGWPRGPCGRRCFTRGAGCGRGWTT